MVIDSAANLNTLQPRWNDDDEPKLPVDIEEILIIIHPPVVTLY